MDSRHMRHCDMGRSQATALRSLLPFLATACLVTALTVPAFSSASAMVRSPASRGAPHRSGTAKILEFQDPSWTLKNLGSVWMSSPVVATIDGVKAVVLGTLSGEIYVVNAKSGRELPGWPQWVHINSPTPTAVDSSPAVAYLDGPDRPPSIIVGAGSLWRPDQQGGLEAFYASGRVRFVFQTRRTFNPWARTAPDDYSDPVFATPAVGDITGTGELDIVFGSYDHNIYVLDSEGSYMLDYVPGVSGIIGQTGQYGDAITKEPGKTQGKKIWQYQTEGIVVGCAYVQNNIIVNTDSGKINNIMHKSDG